MGKRIVWLIIILLVVLGGYFFVQANPQNSIVLNIKSLFVNSQTGLVFTGATDVDESVPVDGGTTISGDESSTTICTMEYAPVCASVAIQCIKAPCNPVEQTFGNKCMMNANKLATFLHEGECTSDKNTGLANPASVNCIDKGGTLEILEGTGGQYGMCHFSNGNQCEEWAFFRGECAE